MANDRAADLRCRECDRICERTRHFAPRRQARQPVARPARERLGGRFRPRETDRPRDADRHRRPTRHRAIHGPGEPERPRGPPYRCLRFGHDALRTGNGGIAVRRIDPGGTDSRDYRKRSGDAANDCAKSAARPRDDHLESDRARTGSALSDGGRIGGRPRCVRRRSADSRAAQFGVGSLVSKLPTQPVDCCAITRDTRCVNLFGGVRLD